MPTNSTALVLAFGNVLLGDDGAGIRVMQALTDQVDAECIDGGTMSFSLLGYLESAGSILLIDAANLESPAGTLALFEGSAMDAFLSGSRRRTVHEVGLIDLLDIARLLGCLPDRRALLCLQPERIDWSTALSAPLERSIDDAVGLAKGLLGQWRAA
jgi:hydrogenase maturation protease